MEKVAVLVNSKHKSRLKKSRLEQFFANSQLQFFYSKTTGDLYQLAKEALNLEFNTIVIVGGDGTVNEIVSAIVDLSKNPFIYIVPRGTGNDYVRSLK